MNNNEKFDTYVENINNLILPKISIDTLNNDNLISLLKCDKCKIKHSLIMVELYGKGVPTGLPKKYYKEKYKELIDLYDSIQVKLGNILTLCETGK